jgi:hypothetical protein
MYIYINIITSFSLSLSLLCLFLFLSLSLPLSKKRVGSDLFLDGVLFFLMACVMSSILLSQTQIHIEVYTWIYTCTHKIVCMYPLSYSQNMCICTLAYIHAYICVYVRMHTYMHIYRYIYIYIFNELVVAEDTSALS